RCSGSTAGRSTACCSATASRREAAPPSRDRLPRRAGAQCPGTGRATTDSRGASMAPRLLPAGLQMGRTPSRASRPFVHARARARAGIARPGAGAILVVDDDPMCCRLMVAALEFDGHRVDWTTVPAQALDLVRKKHYSV